MATNTFKRFVASSISNNSGSPTTVYTCATNKSSIIIGAMITNKTATDATCTIQLVTAITADAGGSPYYLVKDLSVPKASTVELALGKVILTHDNSNGDIIKAYGSAATTFDVILSILEDVN